MSAGVRVNQRPWPRPPRMPASQPRSTTLADRPCARISTPPSIVGRRSNGACALHIMRSRSATSGSATGKISPRSFICRRSSSGFQEVGATYSRQAAPCRPMNKSRTGLFGVTTPSVASGGGGAFLVHARSVGRKCGRRHGELGKAFAQAASQGVRARLPAPPPCGAELSDLSLRERVSASTSPRAGLRDPWVCAVRFVRWGCERVH